MKYIYFVCTILMKFLVTFIIYSRIRRDIV
jgi:hypothetical protein